MFFGTFWKNIRDSPGIRRCPVVQRTTNYSYYLTRIEMHTVWNLNGSELYFWFLDKRTWFWIWKLSRVVVTNSTIPKKLKSAESRSESGLLNGGGEAGGSNFSLFWCTQHFALNFSNFEVYINKQQVYSSDALYLNKSYISNNLKGKSLWIQASFPLRVVPLWSISGWNYGSTFVWNFFTRRMKLLSRPNSSIIYGKLGVDFSTTCDMLYPKMKLRLRLFRARPSFYMISDNPNVSLGIVDCSLYTCRIALKDDYHKKRHAGICSSGVQLFGDFCKDWSFLVDKTSSFKETILTRLQFVNLPLQWIQNLLLLDRTMKVHSGTKNSTSDKLEYPEQVNQL